jgi:hypothetical protein
MTRPGAHGADSSMIVVVVFLVLAALAGALLVLNLTVRKKDVIQGGYVKKDKRIDGSRAAAVNDFSRCEQY